MSKRRMSRAPERVSVYASLSRRAGGRVLRYLFPKAEVHRMARSLRGNHVIETVFAISAIVAPAFAQSAGEHARITLKPAERFQFIEGFGVNFTSPYFRDDQKAMFDTLIKDLGATMFRVVSYLVYSNWEE